ncbi:MAG: helix-turn-helix domain-containing protein [Alistipes finegoldii]
MSCTTTSRSIPKGRTIRTTAPKSTSSNSPTCWANTSAKSAASGSTPARLCITPKYLTTLIKRISGQSVSEWIDNYVILEAKTLLKYSTMSIQEIAYYLNFPNQSFFGSYFKRNTGMSPSQYKAQN